jgi:hypothetical protein
MTFRRATATSLGVATLLAPVFARASFATPAPAIAALNDTLPDCSTDLDLLERKIHQNYAGYVLELRGDRLTRFASMKAAAQTRARKARGDDCFSVLRDFAEWFADPHLFVYQSTRLDTAESARRAQTVAHRTVTEADVRAYFVRRGEKLDPIEGIWYDRGLRVAILPDSSRAATFVAVVLNPDTSTWQAGAV